MLCAVLDAMLHAHELLWIVRLDRDLQNLWRGGVGSIGYVQYSVYVKGMFIPSTHSPLLSLPCPVSLSCTDVRLGADEVAAPHL